MSKRPWTQRWQPPETDEERDIRESFVTPKRARQIRAEIEREPNPRAVIPPPGCSMCGLPSDATCYVPQNRCARARA